MESDILTFEHVYDTLKDYCADFKALIKSKLEQNKASGKLIDSIDMEIKATDDEYKVILHSLDYIKWLENGRKAGSNYPPKQAIEDWIHEKGIKPTEKNGYLPTEQQLVFLISRAIADNGTIKANGYKGTKYVADTVEDLNNRYIPLLYQALEADWNMAAERIVKQLNKRIRL